jgi:hypothetical protein
MSRRPSLGRDTQTDPGSDIFAVTQSDSTNDPNGPFRGFAFGTAGDIKVRTLNGSDVVIPDGVLSAGVIHPIHILFVWTTGTTASEIYGVV